MTGLAYTPNVSQTDVNTALEKAVLEQDTDGNPVPTNRGHSFTYDSSGNLVTDSVTDGTSTWVRTYTYQNGAQTTDSGWVKQ